MFLFPFISGFSGARLWPFSSSSERLDVPCYHSFCACKQKPWSIFLLLRLARPTGCDFVTLSHPFFVLLLSTSHSCPAWCQTCLQDSIHVRQLPRRCSNSVPLSQERQTRKIFAALFIELAHFKANPIKSHSLLRSILKWFATTTENQLTCTNIHGDRELYFVNKGTNQ